MKVRATGALIFPSKHQFLGRKLKKHPTFQTSKLEKIIHKILKILFLISGKLRQGQDRVFIFVIWGSNFPSLSLKLDRVF